MTIVTYQLHLDEPAIFSMLEGDPNAAVSNPYIPGSSIRGLVIGLFIKEQKRTNREFDFDAAEKAWQPLFFSPQTRYLNAYPLINEVRSLPVPATWTVPKYESSETITDSAPSHNQKNTSPRAKSKSVDGFTVVVGKEAHVYKPLSVINVHNTRARRVTEEQQVFRYEALAAGQTFIGAILCENDEHARQLEKLLKDNLHISMGGSRTAGYGRATLSNVRIDSTWKEVEHDTKGDIILTFLSHTIIRDGMGSYLPTPSTLQDALNQMGIQCKVEPLSVKTLWVGGFNRKWGLPLPQTIAIEQGCAVRLTKVVATDQVWQHLKEHGIGERREDGFGRVALGWQHHTQLQMKKVEQNSQHEKVELNDESKKLFNAMRQRIRDRQLEEQIAGMLYNRNYTIYGSISRTQLSRLRSVIANELRKKAPAKAVISNFITHIAGKSAGRQFDSARIGQGQPLAEWLKNPTFNDLPENITGKDPYVLRLVDMVLERAYRERDRQEVK